VLFAVATTLLSNWQFERRQDRVEQIQKVLDNYDQPAIDISELSWPAAEGNSPFEWRPVTVSGQYLSEVFLVRNRPLAGQAGFLQLVPFQLADGKILIVERGWLPASSQLTEPQFNPVPAKEDYRLIVRVRGGEQDLGRDRAQTLASIDLEEVSQRLAVESVITDYYGRLVSESPSNKVMPIAMPKPSLNEGNHLSYAIQWIIFGLMACVAFIWAYRNERRMAAEARGEVEIRTRKKRQAQKDAEFEDANH
jgi:cytochrome oxidase assembly protein ShyY1